MKRRAFTLMELLLVVAILAILAAAAAPTFSSGSADALEEARKSTFLSAYENTVSGANLMMAMLLTNWTITENKSSYTQFNNKFLPPNLSLDAGNQFGDAKKGLAKNLAYYVPIPSRVFKTLKGKELFISAKIGNNQDLVIYWVDPEITQWSSDKGLTGYYGPAATQTGGYGGDYSAQEIHISKDCSIDDVWNKIKNKEPKK